MPNISVITEKCKGCELCADACPKKIIGFDMDYINNKGFHPAKQLNPEDCIGCAMCATMCPDCAIIVER